MATLSLVGISKTYPNGHAGVRSIDLEIQDGEFVVLVGPSGCGKSTLLRIIAGLEAPTTGRISIGGADITEVAPQGRDVAMVFQSYALYPHMSVRDNLSYGLRVRGTTAEVITRRVTTVADALDLTSLLDRRPAQLSGGQRQRVALGRAMVREPKAFLFDEPLSNLDPALRTQARAELLRLHRSLGTTTVYVTHDQEEAMTLAGRVAVMRDGRIEQVAPPMTIYSQPANTFVAQFIGLPAMNLLTVPVPGIETLANTIVGIRPQDIVIDGSGPIAATVDLVEPRGHDVLVHLNLALDGRPSVVASVTPHTAPSPGATVSLQFRREAIHLFDRNTENRRNGAG